MPAWLRESRHSKIFLGGRLCVSVARSQVIFDIQPLASNLISMTQQTPFLMIKKKVVNFHFENLVIKEKHIYSKLIHLFLKISPDLQRTCPVSASGALLGRWHFAKQV